jgi:hypothetical protein
VHPLNAPAARQTLHGSTRLRPNAAAPEHRARTQLGETVAYTASVTQCWGPVTQDNTASVSHRESRRDGQIVARIQQDERARAMFFSAHTPESWIVRYAERLQKEQGGRAVLDMVFLNLSKPRRVSTPLLVLGTQ